MERTRRLKTRSELRIWKHLIVIWGGGIILWPTLTALITYTTIDHGDAFVLTLLTLAINIFGGWVLALLVFLVNWGVRGWVEVGQSVKTAMSEQQQPQTPTPEVTNEAPISEEEMWQRWAQMNPHGCCAHHRGPDGYPAHGGPDCVHPAYRQV